MAVVSDIVALSDRHRQKTALAVGALAGGLAIAFFAAVGHGAVAIAPAQVLGILAGEFGIELGVAYEDVQRTVLLSIRLPRVCLGIISGAALAIAGAALQGLFRNPLADPGLIGVSTGAALAAAATIVLGTPLLLAVPAFLSGYVLPVNAFAGGLLTTFIVYRIASNDGRTEVTTMLLAGVAMNAIAAAGIGLLVFMSDDQQLRDLEYWLLGSLGGVTWERLLPAVPLVIAPTLALLFASRQLDALLLGETEAMHLGFRVETLKRTIIVLAALAVGASVALTGVIAFVGLLVPHLVRLMIGPGHRTLLPASIILGATLLLVADLVARTIVLPAELPIGILTSCLGGPFFIWLLTRRRHMGMW